MESIKWGVLGYARIARLFVIPAIQRSTNSEFYAIASRDKEKLEKCQADFGCKKTYSSYDELLDDPEVQAVYIPLPNSLHKEWTIKAARKGKHILCEKPMALNAAECLEMVEESKKNNVVLMEAFMYRYTDRIRKVREIIDSGVIGDVKYINSTFRFFLNRENDVRMVQELGGGSLYDVGCYPLNFVGMVTGSVPVSVSAEFVKQDGVDVIFSALLRYGNGTIASINCGFNAFGKQFSEIIGTKGIVEVPLTFSNDAGFITVISHEGKREVEVLESDRYQLEIEDFSDAVLHNRKPLFSLDETVRNMRILDDLMEKVRACK